MKFTSSVAGEVTGVRFYKQTWMGGYTHVGHLWSSTGTAAGDGHVHQRDVLRLAAGELLQPGGDPANTVYIVSFSTGGGYFGISTGFFSPAGVTNGPLQALPNSTSGGDGVYELGRRLPERERRRDELLGGRRVLAVVLVGCQGRGHRLRGDAACRHGGNRWPVGLLGGAGDDGQALGAGELHVGLARRRPAPQVSFGFLPVASRRYVPQAGTAARWASATGTVPRP